MYLLVCPILFSHFFPTSYDKSAIEDHENRQQTFINGYCCHEEFVGI